MYECYIPANATATVYKNVNESALGNFEAPQGVTYIGMECHNWLLCAKFTVKSGGYRFEMVKGEIQNKLMSVSAMDIFGQNKTSKYTLLQQIEALMGVSK